MRARPCPLLATVLVALLMFSVTAAPPAPESSGSSSIIGKVTKGDPKKPVVNATVVMYHLSTAQIFRSAATMSTGKFEITGLPHGYYDVAIETPEGLFVANQVVNVPPDGKAVANLQLVPSTLAEQGPREFPGSDLASAGIAQMYKKSKKKGTAILSGVGGAAVLGLAAGGGSSGKSSSPSNPD
jgi:hypothetical protein